MDAVDHTIIIELPASEVTTLPLKTSSPPCAGAWPYSSCSGPSPSTCNISGVNAYKTASEPQRNMYNCRRTLGRLRLHSLFSAVRYTGRPSNRGLHVSYCLHRLCGTRATHIKYSFPRKILLADDLWRGKRLTGGCTVFKTNPATSGEYSPRQTPSRTVIRLSKLFGASAELTNTASSVSVTSVTLSRLTFCMASISSCLRILPTHSNVQHQAVRWISALVCFAANHTRRHVWYRRPSPPRK